MSPQFQERCHPFDQYTWVFEDMTMQQGTIVDATLIAALSSTKNMARQRDTEMHRP